MSMMHIFWMTNIKKEMAYYGKEITDDDLWQYTQISTIVFESDDMPGVPKLSDSISESISIRLLDITSIANLDHDIFNNDNQIITNQTNQTNVNRKLDNINYDVDNLVSQFLENDTNDMNK